MEKKGYLRSAERRNGKSLRKVYRATRWAGRRWRAAKGKVRELLQELMRANSANETPAAGTCI